MRGAIDNAVSPTATVSSYHIPEVESRTDVSDNLVRNVGTVRIIPVFNGVGLRV